MAYYRIITNMNTAYWIKKQAYIQTQANYEALSDVQNRISVQSVPSGWTIQWLT